MTARVADSLCGLDSRWFTTVLREGGHAEAAVTTISMEPMAVSGAIADMARVRLGYDDSGKAGPPTLIAKIRGAAEIQVAMDAAMGLYEREARFYAGSRRQASRSTPHAAFTSATARPPRCCSRTSAACASATRWPGSPSPTPAADGRPRGSARAFWESDPALEPTGSPTPPRRNYAA